MKQNSIPPGFHVHKYHALGNDYIVVDPKELVLSLSAATIIAICDRNLGVGSDGILCGPLESLDEVSAHPESKPADFFLRIFNPDGSEAEKSGNGLRIFSLYLYETGRVKHEPFYIGTKGGVVESRVLPQSNHPGTDEAATIGEVESTASSIDDGIRSIEVAMGEPRFFPGPLEMTFDGISFQTVRVSMGNPHCVLLGRTPSEELARRIGPLVERHPSFPHRTNAQFLEIIDRRNIRIEIWERGAGYTLASGTSSCAAASAARNLGLVDDVVTVHMPGGELQIDMRGGNVRMTGPAVRTFDALLSEQLLRLARAQPGLISGHGDYSRKNRSARG